MPTAARLTAAIFFTLVGLAFAFQASQYFPEAKEPDYWFYLNGAAGAILGWVVCGTRAGSGYPNGIANGVTTGVGMLFWVYFIMSFHDMIKKSLRKSYDGPVEAVVNVFEIMLDWGKVFFIPELGLLMLAGCVVAGFITEFIGKRFS